MNVNGMRQTLGLIRFFMVERVCLFVFHDEISLSFSTPDNVPALKLCE